MRYRYAILSSLLALSLSGCLGALRANPTRYFALQPTVKITAVERSPYTLGVRPLFAARSCKANLLYQEADGELFYQEAQWAELPAVVVTRALRDALAAAGRFADVGDAADLARPDYLLTGELRQFCAKRGPGEALQASLVIRLELREARDVEALWAATLEAQAPFSEESPAAFAAAMEGAIAQALGSATEAITAIPLP